MAAESFAAVALARLLRPWGRRGEVAAEILTDFPSRLASLGEVWLADGRRPPRLIGVRSCRIHLGQALFHFAGVDSITDAEKLRGLEVQVPLADRKAIGPGRHYIDELIGCLVFEQGAAAPLGSVRNVQRINEEHAAESWVLEIVTPEGELLVPLAAEICTLIETGARRIEVRMPDGLRELNTDRG